MLMRWRCVLPLETGELAVTISIHVEFEIE